MSDRGYDESFNHHKYCLAIDGRFKYSGKLYVTKRFCMADIDRFMSMEQILLHYGARVRAYCKFIKYNHKTHLR
jgi:hypothetical protein